MEDSIFYLYTIFLEQSQRPLPGNYGEEVGGPRSGTWKTVSSTLTPTSWSNPRGIYQVTMEKTLEVLCLVPGRQYNRPFLHRYPDHFSDISKAKGPRGQDIFSLNTDILDNFSETSRANDKVPENSRVKTGFYKSNTMASKLLFKIS
jgi:hypothetical protein